MPIATKREVTYSCIHACPSKAYTGDAPGIPPHLYYNTLEWQWYLMPSFVSGPAVIAQYCYRCGEPLTIPTYNETT